MATGREHSATTEHFRLGPNDWVPNNQHCSVIVYRAALPEAQASAPVFERLFASNGWPPRWRDGVFPYHHYHSTAHEALGFARGWARLVLGGPNGREVRVSCGDAVLLPAGVGHFQAEASADFLVVGAYPPGQSFDVCREAPSDAALRRIAGLVRPSADPVCGGGGPLQRLWSE